MDVIEKEQLTSSEAKQHWYYQSKCALLESELKKMPGLPEAPEVADLGCGVGLFLTMLAERKTFLASQLFGIDPAVREDVEAAKIGIRLSKSFDAEKTFDLILMMDVLEHVADDIGLVESAINHLRPGGYLFITVPALPILWSNHDVFLGHFRRYTTRSLTRMLKRCADLTVLRDHYYFASILPAAGPIRIARNFFKPTDKSDMGRVSPFLNSLLLILCKTELKWSSSNKAAGLTVVAVCQKVK